MTLQRCAKNRYRSDAKRLIFQSAQGRHPTNPASELRNLGGLGLAIVSECVANHQGKVESIEPRQDEQGARIRVELPLEEAT